MPANTFVFAVTWNDRVHRFVAFYGLGGDTWHSDVIKPSCPIVAVRNVGPNGRDVVFVGSSDGW